MTIQALICFLVAVSLGGLAQRVRGNFLAFFLLLGFALQYSYSLALLLSPGPFEGNFGVGTVWVFISAGLVWMLLGMQVAGAALGHRKIAQTPRLLPSYSVRVFFVLSVVGLFLILATSGFEMQNRLQARAGAGFVFVFGYAGLALCFAVAAGLVQWRSLFTAIVICSPTSLFFVAAGHRSVALMAILCPFVPLLRERLGQNRFVLPLLVGLSVFSANYVNLATGSIRSLSTEGRDLTLESISGRYQTLQEARPVPLATSHLEMLGGYLERAGLRDKLFGTFETVSASFLNFLPRAIFPDKGLTSGVHFASVYFPEWFSYGYHTSSLTTGLFLDLVFNFGIPLTLVMLLFLYFAAAVMVTGLCRRGGYEAIFGIYAAWVLGFNIFFDDLGGVVNKLVIGFIFYSSARFLGGLVSMAARGSTK